MKKCILFFLFNIVITFCFAQPSEPAGNTSGKAASDTTPVQKPKARKAISIGPLSMHFKLNAGQTGKQTLSFINNSNQRTSFYIEIADWDQNENGEDKYFTAGEVSTSCARWISLEKTFVDVMPKSKETVEISIKIPDSAEAINSSKWSLLFIKSMAEKRAPIKSEDGSVMLQPKSEVAIVARIFQTPPNSGQLIKELKMTNAELLPKKENDSVVYFKISCQNTGTALLHSSFTLDLSSSETGDKYAAEPKKAMLLPGRDRTVNLKLPKDLPKGKYTAVALITPEDEDVPVEASQKDIVIE